MDVVIVPEVKTIAPSTEVISSEPILWKGLIKKSYRLLIMVFIICFLKSLCFHSKV